MWKFYEKLILVVITLFDNWKKNIWLVTNILIMAYEYIEAKNISFTYTFSQSVSQLVSQSVVRSIQSFILPAFTTSAYNRYFIMYSHALLCTHLLIQSFMLSFILSLHDWQTDWHTDFSLMIDGKLLSVWQIIL